MLIPLLHFGFFDREALHEGRLLQCQERLPVRFRILFREFFGDLPGQGSPEPGFFESYGVLSCCCPSTRHRLTMPQIERLLDFVERTRCDVVYVTRGERWLIDADRLRELLWTADDDWDDSDF